MKWKLATLDNVTGYTVHNPTRRNYHHFNTFEEANNFYKNTNDASFENYETTNWVVSEVIPYFKKSIEFIPSGYYSHSGAWSRGDWVELLVPSELRKDGLVFQHDSYDVVMNDLYKFLKNKELYTKCDAQHRRNYLFHGIPGTGKTTMIRKMLHELIKDSLIIGMSKPPSREMIEALNQDKRLKVIVFEEMTTGLSDPSEIKAVLDFLDGERSIDHSIVIATTNYPSELPDNLIDRKGRFDFIMEIGLLTSESSVKFAEGIIKRSLDDAEKAILTKMTMAEIKDACLRHRIDEKPFEVYDKELKEHKENKRRMFDSKKGGGLGFHEW